jgi:hypothetical protein
MNPTRFTILLLKALQLQKSFGLLNEFFPFEPVSDAVLSICYWFIILLSMFISLLYMLRATMCPSSGESTVSMRHWYLSLCMGGLCSAGWSETPTSRPEATHTE